MHTFSIAAVIALMSTLALADFTIFYVESQPDGLGTPDEPYFFFFNNPPDCNDFDGSTSYLVQEESTETGMVCRDPNNNDCIVGQSQITYLSWNDDSSYQMTSCALGDGTTVVPNDNGFNLLDGTGAVRGTCQFISENAQYVNCPASEVDFQGTAYFQCTSDCVAIGTSNG